VRYAKPGVDDFTSFLLTTLLRSAPYAHALRATHDRFVDGRKLHMLLLVGDDHIDAIGLAQALVRHDEQRIGVRRQIDARDRRALIGDEVNETGVLMRETVMILTPYRR
jgi:hypothetical protein